MNYTNLNKLYWIKKEEASPEEIAKLKEELRKPFNERKEALQKRLKEKYKK